MHAMCPTLSIHPHVRHNVLYPLEFALHALMMTNEMWNRLYMKIMHHLEIGIYECKTMYGYSMSYFIYR